MIRCDRCLAEGVACNTPRLDELQLCPACGFAGPAHWEPDRHQIRAACAEIQAAWNERQEQERRHPFYRTRLVWPVTVSTP